MVRKVGWVEKLMAELILACLNILYIFLEYDDADQPNVHHQEKIVSKTLVDNSHGNGHLEEDNIRRHMLVKNCVILLIN